MLTGIVRFTDDAAGLEKTLRFCQYVSQTVAAILAASSTPKRAQPWTNAYLETARVRRYFRLLKWYESFGMSRKEFYREQAPSRRALEVSKWSFLGLYFFFEMFTITNEMGITNYSWGAAMQREADKYWLYAIVASILVSLHQLLLTSGVPQAQAKLTGDEKDPSAGAASDREHTARLKTFAQLAIDCADVIIPTAGLGWVPLDDVYVGAAGTISTLIAGYELWIGVQSRFTSVEQ